MAVKAELETYISEITSDNGIDSSTNLFEGGFLSSLDVLDLISFIEIQFKITLSEDDMTMENLSTINNMVSMIERLKNSN
jgi:acyl carrier protein